VSRDESTEKGNIDISRGMSCDPVWNRREDDQLIEPASANRRAAGDSGVVIFGYDDPEGRLRGRLCTEGILRFWNLGSHIARTDLDSSSPKVSCRNRPRWTDDPGVGFHPMNSRTSSSIPPRPLPRSLLPPASYKSSATSTSSKPATVWNPSAQTAPVAAVTRDVALKAIPKKTVTVEGNDTSRTRGARYRSSGFRSSRHRASHFSHTTALLPPSPHPHDPCISSFVTNVFLFLFL
jgi:hypothetical protein